MSRSGFLPCPVGTDALPPTLSAHACAVVNDPGVLGSELVVVNAVSLRCVESRRIVRPQDVLSGGDRTHVVSVDAPLGVAEEVVELKSSGDWSILLNPGPDVTTRRMTLAEELCITPMIEVSRPQVAASDDINDVTGSKPSLVVVVDDLDEGGVSVPEPARVVLTAPATAVAFYGAVVDRAEIHDMSLYREWERCVA